MYFKLVKAKTTSNFAAMQQAGYEELGEHYVVEENNDTYDEIYCDNVDIVNTVTVKTVTIIGSENMELRCYDNEADAVIDENGDYWLHEDLYVDTFC